MTKNSPRRSRGDKKKLPLAIFDIDGTLFRKNLQFELLEGLSYEGIFSRKSRDKLVEYYRAWLENKNSYEAYRKMLIHLYRKEIKGCDPKEVKKVAKRVAAFHHGRLFVYTSDLFKKLKKTHFMVAISGSPVEIVSEFNQYLDFDRAYGTVFEVDEKGLYTGKEEFVPVADKSQIVKELISGEGYSTHHSYGVGDTDSDVSFLSMVDHPIAFNPDLSLKKKAEREGWRIIVERKDVVYEIR